MNNIISYISDHANYAQDRSPSISDTEPEPVDMSLAEGLDSIIPSNARRIPHPTETQKYLELVKDCYP